MKKLSIEEKAKAYDEAKYIMKEYLESGNAGVIAENTIKKAFPELAESEDERIRKDIIVLVEDWWDRVNKDNISTKEQMIAWLEKQKQDDLTNYKKTLSNYDEAEKEKCDFVGDGFIKCYADFQDFKEGETYWFEYIGDDKYNVRSDNLLGKMYHITPCQLYTIFKKQTWLEKQKTSYTKRDVEDAYIEGVAFAKNELEKQGSITKLSEEEQNRFAKGVLTSCAFSFIDYLDAHKYEGKMCVSNGECEDIENAFHNAMWDRLHRYYCKYIEKQGEPTLKAEPSGMQTLNTWSEEDETNFQGIMNEIKANKHEAPDYDIPIYYRYIYWLKSLKQRIGG